MLNIFSVFWEARNVPSIFYVYLREHKMSSTLWVYSRIHNLLTIFSCVFWENTKCPILYAYSRNHKCGVFYGNANYLIHTFKKTQNVEYFTLVLKKPWTLSILCECKVSHAYLRNENSKYLNAYLRKQKKVQYFIHTQETTYVKYFLRMSSTLMHIWGSMNVEYLMHIWETTNVKYFPQMFRTLHAILPSLITGPCSSIHSICLCPSTYLSCQLNKFDVHKCWYSIKKHTVHC